MSAAILGISINENDFSREDCIKKDTKIASLLRVYYYFYFTRFFIIIYRFANNKITFKDNFL